MEHRDTIYILSLVIGAIVVLLLIFHYNIYLWGKPAIVYVFTSSNCNECRRYVVFVSNTLSNNGFRVRIYYKENSTEYRELRLMLDKFGLPNIVPLSIVCRKGVARGVILGDWEGMPLWEFLRDNSINNSAVLPVFKWGDVIGFISSDKCFLHTLPMVLDEGKPSLIYSKCKGNYAFFFLGSNNYNNPNFP